MESGLLIIQSGGPTAVSNTGLASAVAAASNQLPPDAPILGARRGMLGAVEGYLVDLRSISSTRWKAIQSAPGAALGSSRHRADDESLERLVASLRRVKVRMVLIMGGNGSMAAAGKLRATAAELGYELAVAGIPFTVDNDVKHTDFCLGYGSAARYYAQAILDLSADLRSLPTPVSVLEVMGRNAGWLAAASVLARENDADAPHRVYLPEAPLRRDRFLADIGRLFDRHGWVVVVAAEGLGDEKGEEWAEPFETPSTRDYGGRMIGDVAPRLARLVTRDLGLRARCEKPGLLARAAAGDISELDRRAAAKAAEFSIREMLRGESGFMTSLRQDGTDPFEATCEAVPLSPASSAERLLPQEFLNAEDQQPNGRFDTYAKPLIGGPLRHYDTAT